MLCSRGVLFQHALQVVSQYALQWGDACCQVGGGVEPPPKADGYCCGWYASYWNAFLLPNLCVYEIVDFLSVMSVMFLE